jgi:GxxExxY protein
MVETRSAFDDPQTYAIVGAGMAVHRELGCGFLEHVYQEAFTIELRQRSIPFAREAPISVKYRGHVLPVLYKLDFMCYGAVAVELKALRAIGTLEEAQLINYLRAAPCTRGLILNFGATSFQHRRLVLALTSDPIRR